MAGPGPFRRTVQFQVVGSRDYLIRVFGRIGLPSRLRLLVSSVVFHNSGLRLPRRISILIREPRGPNVVRRFAQQFHYIPFRSILSHLTHFIIGYYIVLLEIARSRGKHFFFLFQLLAILLNEESMKNKADEVYF